MSVGDFAALPERCPGCDTQLREATNSHGTLWVSHLCAALCDCWTGWRIYDQATGRCLSFEEMGEFVGMSDGIPEGSDLKLDVYGFATYLYERLVFDFHAKCEEQGLWASKWDLHRFNCMDPRVRGMSERTFDLLWGLGGGNEQERRRERDRQLDLQGLMAGIMARTAAAEPGDPTV